MTKTTTLLVTFSLTTMFISLQAQKEFWNPINESNILVTGKRDIVPEKYKTYHLDINSLKKKLAVAPLDNVTSADNSTIIISLPMPDGNMQKFKIAESPVMDNALQMSYPGIRTYNVKGVDDVFANGKLDMTEFGFHGMIRSPHGDVFIDPYCKWNTEDYIAYYTNDFNKPLSDRLPEIDVLNKSNLISKKATSPSILTCSGANLHTYRLAVACTGEYAQTATGSGNNIPTKSQILAKVVTSVNRVDGVYETELSVKLILIATDTLILYGDPSTDPFNGNNSAYTLIGESQTVIDSVIGTANYDIGHTFSTGGGGLAQLGCVCFSNLKANGITGNPSPVGDPYDIDYVAHEIGHQFGGEHSFNGNQGSCAGNRNASTAVEPGSGVTIMSYAGICNANNIANNSIPYFHTINHDEMMAFINSTSCGTITPTGNNPPVVTGSANFTIPVNTPFQLTGSATDPDGDALTYQWEEIDTGAGSGSWNSGSKPFFMSNPPVISPTRSFPKSSVILSGNMQLTPGEYLPTTSQTLKFRLTARDNKIGGGGVCSASTQISISSSGPFAVTSQNTTGITYPNGSTQTITWDVNGTNAPPVNCANVNIYISTDNGNTFSLSLANTPNDGSENIVLPTVSSFQPACRVKVESVGNIFFDINDKYFAISAVSGLNQYANSLGLSLQLYPNPFSGLVKIDITADHSSEKMTLNVYDILGNIVKTETIKVTDSFSKLYDFSYLANGSYIVEITDSKQKAIARLLKI